MPNPDKIEKFRKYVYLVFRGLLLVTAAFAAFRFHWQQFAFLLLILFLTYLPQILEGKTGIDYPGELEILILFFVMASLYLGEMHDYYNKFPWWDTFLHSLSGIVIGGIGFSLVFILHKSKKIGFKLSPGFVCLFAFCFSVALGAVWEIFEFAMDQFLGLNMQRSGLVDTMGDLILDCGGALVFSVLGYFHIKHEIRMFDWLEKKFFKLNPGLKK